MRAPPALWSGRSQQPVRTGSSRTRALCGLPHPRHDIGEFLVGSRKRQRAFCLDFEDRVGAVSVGGLDDHVVKRTARTALLEFNSTDGRARQASRFAAGKQRQKIKRADLSLELRAGIAGRTGGATCRDFKGFLDTAYGVLDLFDMGI